MYLEFYSLREKPFSLTPDPAFLYYSNVHRRAVAFLKYGLDESKGFLQLTGPVGSGKTTLLRAILAQLDERTRTAYIINPCASFPDLLRSIMRDLEIPNAPQTRLKIELLDFFHDYLLSQMKRSQPVIIIFDEAQNLSSKNLEEIRMLSNFETTKEKLIQIVFVGQPELVKKLDLPELRQLKQRIQVRYHLSALNLSEVRAYIHHRLHVAGSDGTITFSDDAITAIYEFSGGIPRLINSVCDVVLLIGYVNERKEFDAAAVKEAIKELQGSFDDEPLEGAGDDGCSTAAGDFHGEAEAPDDSTADPLEASPSFSDRGTENPSHAPRGRDSDTVAGQGNPAPDHQAGTNRRTAGVAGAVAEPEAPEQPPDAPESPEIQGACSSAPHVTDGLELTPSELSCSSHDRLSVVAPPKPGPGLFHSFFARTIRRDFRVTSSGIAKPAELEKDFRVRIRELVKKWMQGRNGNSASVTERAGLDALNGPSMSAVTQDSQPSRSIQEDGTDDLAEQSGGLASAVALRLDALRSGSHHPGIAREKDGRARRIRRSRPLRGRVSPPPACFVNTRLMVLFEDGRIMRGIVKHLDTKMPGFYLSPVEPQYDAREKFVAFEQIIALRLCDDFENGWKKKYAVTNHTPKTRQIIVTLAHGEVVEGITLRKFDPACKRFFIISTNNEGEPSWSLVERTGTVGILTENFKEGIYAEEFENLASVIKTSTMNAEPACQHESAGDFYFSLNDYDAALLEYQEALKNGGDGNWVALKISVSHFNRGIKYMRRNKFHDAIIEFEKVAANDHLREKASLRIEKIERVIKT